MSHITAWDVSSRVCFLYFPELNFHFLMSTFVYRNNYLAFANQEILDCIVYSHKFYAAALTQAIGT